MFFTFFIWFGVHIQAFYFIKLKAEHKILYAVFLISWIDSFNRR
jgi:hypothetical protein